MKTIFIENNFDSFKDFHDKEWFSDLYDLIDGSEISDEVEEFTAHWWGASRAFVLPWLLVDGVYEVVNEMAPILDKTKQDYWDEYLKSMAFKSSLWKTAESTYISIYYAYENLVVSLVNKNKENPNRVTDRGFISALNNELGESLANKVWHDSFVAVSREIRNCLVHRGGKASPKLLKMRPLPQIKKEDILISATDVRSLYLDFKRRVVRLVQHYNQ